MFPTVPSRRRQPRVSGGSASSWRPHTTLVGREPLDSPGSRHMRVCGAVERPPSPGRGRGILVGGFAGLYNRWKEWESA